MQAGLVLGVYLIANPCDRSLQCGRLTGLREQMRCSGGDRSANEIVQEQM